MSQICIDISTWAWVPASVRRALSGQTVSCPVPERVRGQYHRPPRLPLLRWAQRHRVMGRDRTGWDRRKTPHAVGIMKALDHPLVETVVLCKTPQTGGTEILLNCVGSYIHQDPADMMIVTPDDDLSRVLSRERIQPMVNASDALSSHLLREDEPTGKRVPLDTMTIYLSSANSPSQLASRACRRVFFDETDKYPVMASKTEADPISLGKARATTFEIQGRKFFFNSTPTNQTGNIWQQLALCQLVFHFWVRCPHCRRRQIMSFKQIRWEGGHLADPNAIEAERLAWYECPHCGTCWDDLDRHEAAIMGAWRADSGGHERFRDHDKRAQALGMHGLYLSQALATQRVTSVGFHAPVWISPLTSMSQAVGAFLRAPLLPAGWRDFSNRFEALPWVNVVASRKEDQILALRDEALDDGVVPEWANVLLAGIDTQDNGFWYEIRAFQFGPMLRSHGVRRGFVDTFAALEDVLRSIYSTEDGRTAQVERGFIDAMGHRTTEVYDWCRKHRHIWPVQGVQRLAEILPPPTKIDRAPDGRTIPGGILLQRVDVNVFKDSLASKLEITVDDPGAFTFSAGLSAKEARHYVAEEVDPKTGYWVCASGRANHLWDCSVYVLACARKWGVQYGRGRDQAQETPPAVAPAAQVQRRKRKVRERGW